MIFALPHLRVGSIALLGLVAGAATQDTAPTPLPGSGVERQSSRSPEPASAEGAATDLTGASSQPNTVGNSDEQTAPVAPDSRTQVEQQRTALNLLGQTDANSEKAAATKTSSSTSSTTTRSRNSTFGWEPPRLSYRAVNAAYWFSKALDIGGSYTNNASPRDARNAVAQHEFLSQEDLKGRSNFDQPHAFLLQFGYETPRVGAGPGWVQKLFGSWNLSVVALLKTGTPFTVMSGSDAPGIGNVDGDRRDRPMVVDPSVLGRTIGHPDNSTQLLPRSAFRSSTPPPRCGATSAATLSAKGISLT